MQSSSQFNSGRDDNREKLRALLVKTNEENHQKKETFCSGTGAGEDLNRAISDLNEVNKRIDKPREEIYDAENFALLAACATEATKKMAHGGQGHTAVDFISALRFNYVHTHDPQNDGRTDPDAFCWAEAGEAAAHLFREAPRFFCMLGPMDVQLKVRKQQKAREARKPLGAVTRPDEEGPADGTEDKQQTDRIMEEMILKLRALQQVPLAELICNHECFAQTVENLFTLSFLVRDNKVRLTKNQHLGTMVVAVQPQAAGERAAGAVTEPIQMVISLQDSDWEVMKTMIPPENCVMSTRIAQNDGPAPKRRCP